jgi:protein gp37
VSDKTNIAWTDSTWNPWRGCSKVSAGCKNCYAESLVNGRMGGDFSKRVRAAKATFDAPLRWQKKPWVCEDCGYSQESSHEYFCDDCASAMLHRRHVFLGSLMDWLDPEAPVEWLADALDIIRRCPDLTFQLLTKRPEQFQQRMCDIADSDTVGFVPGFAHLWALGSPPPNVHVIVSVEDQASADERIPHLLSIPAVVRGLSVEPILERIDLSYDIGTGEGHRGTLLDGIGWVIVGGESGPNRREAEGGTVEAVTDIVRQCREAGVPCLVKQDCAARPGQQGRLTDEVWDVKQFPK